MCGIAGGWWPQSGQARIQLSKSLLAMQYRGPDDQGIELYDFAASTVALAQVRLSIIDLSAAGHQPMHSRDGRWAIVFNGEIYNYRELRTELQALGHDFGTDTDTEVLLTAWKQWGAACLPRVAGMFAFAVLDKKNNLLTCVRDAFGIKPFFYTAAGPGFRFASELPALLALLPAKPELNWQRAYDYLVHADYDSGSHTFYDGVYHLPPGHWLNVDLNSGIPSTPQRWWIPDINERPDWKFDDAVEQVREQFLQNIRLHLRSDVPLGAALSGGIDSSAVVCAMRYLEPNQPINTFSYIAAGSDVNEENWVDRVNEHVGAIAHKVSATGVELARDLDDMIRVQGEPFGSTSIYAQYRVFQLAKASGVTVTLDGQGADEMLAGYSGYPGQRLRSIIESAGLAQALSYLNKWAEWPGRDRLHGIKALVGQMTGGAMYEGLRKLNGDRLAPKWLNEQVLCDGGVSVAYPKNFPELSLKGRRLTAELAASLSQRGVTALLRHGDRNSMRFSIESRVPFLTLDLANMLLSMPENYLIAPNGETKHVFRAAMRGIVPDDILDRKDKVGFVTPEKDWLLSMAPTMRTWLSVPIDLPIINQSQLLKEFDHVVNGKAPFTWQVWRWVNFCRWYQLNKCY